MFLTTVNLVTLDSNASKVFESLQVPVVGLRDGEIKGWTPLKEVRINSGEKPFILYRDVVAFCERGCTVGDPGLTKLAYASCISQARSRR
jgi:hypothetical protein